MVSCSHLRGLEGLWNRCLELDGEAKDIPGNPFGGDHLLESVSDAFRCSEPGRLKHFLFCDLSQWESYFHDEQAAEECAHVDQPPRV